MSGSDPLLGRLADADPVSSGRVEGASRSPAADRVLDEIVSSDRRSVRRRRTGVGRRVAVVTSALIVALIGGVLLVQTWDRAPRRAPGTASDLLLRTATVAAELSAPRGTGAFVFTKVRADERTTIVSDGRAFTVVRPVVRTTWIAADGSGWTQTRTGPARFLGPRDRAAWRSAGKVPFESGRSTEPVPLGALSGSLTGSIPTDPEVLLARLRSQAAEEGQLPTNVGVFLRVGELLSSGDASPVLRASLYEVASGLPGVDLAGDAVDPVGRPGVAVAMTYDESGSAIRVLMIFDPESSRLLAQEQILLERASWVDAPPARCWGTSHTCDRVAPTPIPRRARSSARDLSGVLGVPHDAGSRLARSGPRLAQLRRKSTDGMRADRQSYVRHNPILTHDLHCGVYNRTALRIGKGLSWRTN